MLFDDTYHTIAAPAEGLFTDKGSKFIAYLYPVRNEAETKILLAEIKANHPKARHHCWALRLTPDRSVFRINDDGEPSGTAGRPILNTLLSKEITNVFAVVVRYFGGTLLGVPGLINAYKTATEDALKNTSIITKTVNDLYAVLFDYLQMNDVMRIVKDEGLEILEQQFDNQCRLTTSIRQTQVNKVTARLNNLEGITLNYLYTA